MTAKQNIAARAFEQMYGEDNIEAAGLLAVVRRRIEQGLYGDVVPFIGQPWRTRTWHDGDVWSFIRVKTALDRGQAKAWMIPVGTGPLGERDWKRNEQELRERLPDGFYVEVADPCPSDRGDGTFYYSPLDTHVWGETEEKLPGPYGSTGYRELRDGERLEEWGDHPALVPLPLEIGCTDATTTALHLFTYGGVARWPFNSSEIMLLVALDKELINARPNPTATDR